MSKVPDTFFDLPEDLRHSIKEALEACRHHLELASWLGANWENPEAPAVWKQLRTDRGLNRDQLKKMAGVSGNNVSRWESGARKPTGKAGSTYRAVIQHINADLYADSLMQLIWHLWTADTAPEDPPTIDDDRILTAIQHGTHPVVAWLERSDPELLGGLPNQLHRPVDVEWSPALAA